MQQNPASAHGSAAASDEINAQVGQMRRMVDNLVSMVSGAVNDQGIKRIEKETPLVLWGGLGKTPHGEAPFTVFSAKKPQNRA